MKFFNKKINKGFTLIEVMVSITLFSVVLIMSGGTIVSVIDINRRNQFISSVVNNLNYSVDSMVRDIKTGYAYKCNYNETNTIAAYKASLIKGDGVCGVKDFSTNEYGLTLISTISGVDTLVNYRFVPKEESGNGYIEKTVYGAGAPSSYSITDRSNVNINDLSFNVKNPDPLDCLGTGGVTCTYGQPYVFVSIKGESSNKKIDASKFFLQTFISQRFINITDFKE